MKKSLFRRRLGLALAVGLLAGGGVAYATGAVAGGADSVIVGCAKDQNGQLRIVADAAQCLPSEHAVAFQAPAAPPQQSFTVDCAAGQKINDVLAGAAAGVPLFIAVKGTCTEAVQVSRDDVVLSAVSPGSGIAAPTANATALRIDGAEDVQLLGIALTGGRAGLAASGGVFGARQLHVTGAGDGVQVSDGVANLFEPTIESSSGNGISLSTGNAVVHVQGGAIRSSGASAVSMSGGSSADLRGVTIDGCGRQCASVRSGAALELWGGTVQHSAESGVDAFAGGSVNVGGGAVIQDNWSGVGTGGGHVNLQGAIVRHNDVFGVFAGYGGSVTLQGGSVVEDNGRNGVRLSDGSSAKFQGGEIVRRNGLDGVEIDDTSVAEFENGDNVIVDNGGWGVFCQPSPAVAMIHVRSGIGTVSGNGAGEVSCPSTP